jgi:hypothetical protein
MVDHSSRTHSSKITLQRWKIPKLEEFGKNQLVNEILNLFYYLIGLIFANIKFFLGFFNLFEESLMLWAQNCLYLQVSKKYLFDNLVTLTSTIFVLSRARKNMRM